MKHPKTWVVVANAETARLFDFGGRLQPLVPQADHVWHAPEINESADVQGVTHSSVGQSQHRLAPHTGPDKQADAFATEIAQRLDMAEKSDAFERLILIAAPRMLGIVRDKLNGPVRAKIWTEIDKDFTHMPLEKIDEALKSQLYV